ncbi:MAG TPA: folylpolyglutamate synthase/dihydrofolate synthase family protein [bacterium]
MNVVSFLGSLINYEKVPGYHYDLDAYTKFLRKLGSPQKKLKNIVLIAGTKGKGSTAAMVNSCLIANGYKTGLYTSPHLRRINERIRINNKEISNKELDRYIKIIKPLIDHKTRIGARTFFEVLTTMAFIHFARHKVDIAVLEVGLGGRLDATNVVTGPVIPVITRIGYDHMNMLGKTLERIAREKAGIIKKIPPPLIPPHLRGREGWGVTRRILEPTVITIHQRSVVEKVLRKVARKRKHAVIFANDLHRIKVLRMDMTGMDVHIKGRRGEFDAHLPMAGRHQVENLSLALAVVSRLRDQGIEINIPAVKAGIANTKLQGRFEVISKKPLVIFDVAHNEDSFRALEQNLNEVFWSRAFRLMKDGAKDPTPKRGLFLIFGCSTEKDINYAIKHIFPKAREVLLVKADHPRAMEPVEIFKSAKKYQKNIIIAGTVKKALEYLKTRITKNSATIIFGSFYLYPKNR